MRKSILFFLLGLSGIASAQWGQNAGARFYWSKQGSAAQTDSIRFIAGSGASLTQSGNTLTIASTPGAGSIDSTNIVNLSVAATDLVNLSVLNGKIANGAITVNKFASSVYPAIRGKVGWTSDGTITSDTLTTRVELGGSPSTSLKIFDVDGDTISILPQGVASKYVWLYKDGATILAAVDSAGYLYAQALDQIGSGNMVIGNGTLTTELQFNSAGNFTYNNWQKKPDMLEFLGGALKETSAAGASDTTANYMPMKAFSVNDTATFDIFLSKRFTSLDSIVVYAYSNTATSAVVFNCGVRQTAVGDAIAGAFNTAATKTISTGTAGTLRQWSMTSFGSLTASTPSMLRGKIYRTAGGTGGDIFVNRVLIYGVGLR